MFLLFLFYQIIPIDLESLPVIWRKYNYPTAKAAMADFKGDYEAKINTLALFACEQPAREKGFLYKAPNHNLCGIHPWGRTYPWSWLKNYWSESKVKPSGFHFAKEGLTGKIKPFFSFNNFSDCFKLTYQIVLKRRINFITYNRRWVGISDGVNKRFLKNYKRFRAIFSSGD